MSATEPKQARSQQTRRRLLDAAVDELVEVGYARLTTPSVAARAGVSRGAQQHHFPHKATLVGEAVRHLAERQLAEIRAGAAQASAGSRRVEHTLDLMFEAYSGPMFKATMELTFAARGDEELAEAVAPIERYVSSGLLEQAAELFGEDVAGRPDFDARFRHAASTIRGLALLRLLGHPARTIERQWRWSRAELARFLTAGG